MDESIRKVFADDDMKHSIMNRSFQWIVQNLSLASLPN